MPTWPVDLLTYLGCLPMEQQTFDLGEGLAVQNRTAGGEVIRSGGAARLWSGGLVLMARRYEDAREVHAKLHALRGAGGCFYIGDLTFKPALGTAQIKNVTAAGQLVLQAAPVGRVIRAGDYLSWDYANGRRALHQVVSGRTVKSNGETDGIEVVPPIRAGWAAGFGVQLGKPACKAVLLPGETTIGSSNRVATMGVALRWTQTLRETP